MSHKTVSVVRYEKPLESVRKAVDLCRGLDHMPSGAKVFIKPNIVFWTAACPFPKYGVITTSRVVEDMVVLLKERGIDDITIGEGMVMSHPKDVETPAHAFESLGYNLLKQRYGVKPLNVFQRPFRNLDLGDGIELHFNQDALDSDFVVNLPVMKTHAQAIVSLGIKNLKGLIDIESRKICHNADPQRDLNFHIARLADKMPPMFTLLDGIYTAERGPSFDGKMHRSNLLVGSADVLAADLVGAKILGYDADQVPHLARAARNWSRPTDLIDLEVVGEKIEDVASYHEAVFEYNEDGSLPMGFVKMGMQGLSYKKYDLTMCTYCSGFNGVVLTAIARAWKGQPWDDVEILTGKAMEPTPGKKRTILLGKCMVQANKNHPNIQEMIPIAGCPPTAKQAVKALHQAGIMVDPAIFEHADQAPGFYLKRYEGKPEFEQGHFHIT